jgi:hypothetical protein
MPAFDLAVIPRDDMQREGLAQAVEAATYRAARSDLTAEPWVLEPSVVAALLRKSREQRRLHAKLVQPCNLGFASAFGDLGPPDFAIAIPTVTALLQVVFQPVRRVTRIDPHRRLI